jgi:hypothetical protein
MTNARTTRSIIFCKECGARLSGPLSLFEGPIRESPYGKPLYGEPLLPAGCYALSELVLANPPFYGVEPRELLVGIADLDGALATPRTGGCCGPSGHEGPNLVCPDGHPVGTQIGDCWQQHFCHLPLKAITLTSTRPKPRAWKPTATPKQWPANSPDPRRPSKNPDRRD